MRVLQIVHDYLPEHKAGVEIYTWVTVQGLSEKVEVAVFTTEARYQYPDGKLRQKDFLGTRIYEASFHRLYRDFEHSFRNPVLEKAFAQVLDEFQPDVLHIQHLMFHSLGYLSMARERGIPVVYTLHDYWLTCPDLRGGIRLFSDDEVCEEIDIERCARCIGPRLANSHLGLLPMARLYSALPGFLKRNLMLQYLADKLRSFLGRVRHRKGSGDKENPEALKLLERQIRTRLSVVKEAMGMVDMFISPSRFLIDVFSDFGIPEEKFVHLDCGYNTQAFEGLVRTSSDKVRFAFMGTPSPHKGAQVALEAFTSLREGQAEFHLYGTFSQFSGFSRKLRQRYASHPGITFHESYDYKDLASIYARTDVLLMPSIWFENSPLVFHEAALAGVWTLTSDYGAMKEFIHEGVNGYLFKRNDPVSMARAMERVLENHPLTPSPVFEVLSVDEHLNRLLVIYRRLLSRPRNPLA